MSHSDLVRLHWVPLSIIVVSNIPIVVVTGFPLGTLSLCHLAPCLALASDSASFKTGQHPNSLWAPIRKRHHQMAEGDVQRMTPHSHKKGVGGFGYLRQGLYIALAVLGLAMYIRLASNSEIHLSLPFKGWD